MKVIYHSRRNFYLGRPVYWYEFKSEGGNVQLDTILGKFLRVPFTIYYEFGGEHTEALSLLTSNGITSIIEGREI